MELYKDLEVSVKNRAKVTIEGKLQNIIFDHEDILYSKYKVLSLYQMMTTINNDIEAFMKSDMAKLEKRNDLNSMEDMGIAMKNVTEYKYLSPLYNKHLKIVEDINQKCQQRNIMKLVDLQSTIISGVNYKGKKKGANHISKNILENKNSFSKEDFIRLLCIIKYYSKESDIKSLIDIIESETVAINNIDRQIINFFTMENTKINIDQLKNMDKYIVLHRNKYKYNTTEDEDNKKDKRYLCIKESKLTTICDMCCKNELPKDLFEYIEPPENVSFYKCQGNFILDNKKDTNAISQNLIIFNIGGLSNYEVASIEKAISIGQFNFNMIYGGNKIYNYTEYFNEIKEYLEGKNGISYEDKENPDDFYENNEYEIPAEEEEEKKKKKKKKKKNKRKESSSDRDNYDRNDINSNKSKDYVKIEMKNMDDIKDKNTDKNIDKDKDKLKNKKEKEEDEEEDEKELNEEEKPKIKEKKKNVKKATLHTPSVFSNFFKCASGK
jgi:hypothetical protein